MIYANDFWFGQNQQEMLQMDQVEFPYACYYRELDTHFNRIVPWHWHTAIEIDYILDGELILMTPHQTYTLKKGDICFINPGVLHNFQHADPTCDCKFYAHLFHASFLAGMHNSQIEQKYFLSVIGNSAMNACLFRCGSEANNAMLSVFLRVVDLDLKRPFGFEFTIRAELSELWCIFFRATMELHEHSGSKEKIIVERIKVMIQYIHDHYYERISLTDIANSARVSRQECMRCFQKCIHMSPINYLTEYRIRIAAQELLHTDLSITTISENNGFSSNSYFTKVFHGIMGCTPKEYCRMKEDASS